MSTARICTSRDARSSSGVSPQTVERYPGTSGSTHGDRKERARPRTRGRCWARCRRSAAGIGPLRVVARRGRARPAPSRPRSVPPAAPASARLAAPPARQRHPDRDRAPPTRRPPGTRNATMSKPRSPGSGSASTSGPNSATSACLIWSLVRPCSIWLRMKSRWRSAWGENAWLSGTPHVGHMTSSSMSGSDACGAPAAATAKVAMTASAAATASSDFITETVPPPAWKRDTCGRNDEGPPPGGGAPGAASPSDDGRKMCLPDERLGHP